MESSNENVWNPLSFLSIPPTVSYSLIFLNQKICLKTEIVKSLWNSANVRLTVDGGTDTWFDWMKSSKLSKSCFHNEGLPDLITGDFDSIFPETLSLCREKGVKILETIDQDQTDFEKGLHCLENREFSEIKTDFTIVIIENSGRLDQILSILNTLHLQWKKPIVLLSSCSATWLLRPGKHVIEVSELLKSSLLSYDRWIGIFPLGMPATVTTTGLKWNLDSSKLNFGGLVSSSNTYSNDPYISIETDENLVWTIGLAFGNKD